MQLFENKTKQKNPNLNTMWHTHTDVYILCASQQVEEFNTKNRNTFCFKKTMLWELGIRVFILFHIFVLSN